MHKVNSKLLGRCRNECECDWSDQGCTIICIGFDVDYLGYGFKNVRLELSGRDDIYIGLAGDGMEGVEGVKYIEKRMG